MPSLSGVDVLDLSYSSYYLDYSRFSMTEIVQNFNNWVTMMLSTIRKFPHSLNPIQKEIFVELELWYSGCSRKPPHIETFAREDNYPISITHRNGSLFIIVSQRLSKRGTSSFWYALGFDLQKVFCQLLPHVTYLHAQILNIRRNLGHANTIDSYLSTIINWKDLIKTIFS